MKKKTLAILLASIFAAGGATFGIMTACRRSAPPSLDASFEGETVCFAPPSDGSTPMQHTAVENIGYMAYRLKHQESWYSEMHGTVDTILSQKVDTYKQFSDGVLISADISVSSLVKTAKQSCYVGDYVLQRKNAEPYAVDESGKSNWDGLNTKWSQDEPSKITVDEFKQNYGFPATEFSVYVLNEETILSAEDVVDNGDGTYSQTYTLDPDGEKAPYYYRQQMLTTGGLDDWPSFDSIRVTYTFDSSWQVLRSVICESYTATMIVSVGCTAEYETVYEYGTDRAHSADYEEFYSQYADKPVDEVPERTPPTAAGCLTQAFADALSSEAVYDLSLRIGETPLSGTVTLDLPGGGIRAALGDVALWLQDGTLYLSYGGVNLRAEGEEAAALLSALLPGAGELVSGASPDLETILGQLGEGEFSYDDTQAHLAADLTVGGIALPVRFSFLLDGEGKASLGGVETTLTLGGTSVHAALTPGTEGLPALTGEDSFLDAVPYAQALMELFGNEQFSVGASYTGGGVSLTADAVFEPKTCTASGTLSVAWKQVQKTIPFAISGGTMYADIDGLRLSADIKEGAAWLLPLLGVSADVQTEFRLDELLGVVFSETFASLFSAEEQGDVLRVSVAGTQLLEALGIDFSVGDVQLGISKEGLSVEARGISLMLGRGEPFAVETEGYTDILPYAEQLYRMFTGEALRAELSLAAGGLSVSGTAAVSLAEKQVLADLTLRYQGIVKDVTAAYSGGFLYLTADELRVKLAASEAVTLLGGLMEIPSFDGKAETLLETLFSLDLGSLFSVREEGNALLVAADATRLFRALGMDLALGDVSLTLKDGVLAAEAKNIALSLAEGEPFAVETEGFTDLSGVPQQVLSVIQAKAIAFSGEIVVKAGETPLTFLVREGHISWENGLSLYFDASLFLEGAQHDLLFRLHEDTYEIGYGPVGVRLEKAQFSDLESALVALYGKIKASVEETVGGSEGLLPEIGGLNDLLALVGAGRDLSALLSALDGDALLASLGDLTLLPAEQPNGILAVSLGALRAELLRGDDSLVLTASYSGGSFALSCEAISFAAGGELPAFPSDVKMLTAEDVVRLFGFAGTAAEQLAQDSFTLSAQGTIEEGGIGTYAFTATFAYRAGEGHPVHIDLDGKNFWLEPDLYARVTLDLVSLDGAGRDVTLDAYLLDANADGTQDGMLDVYLSLSLLPRGGEGYAPLKLYAPSADLMTVLSAALPMLGIESDVLNDFLVSKWLDVQTCEQLRAVGAMLAQTLDISSLLPSEGTASADTAAARQDTGARAGVIRELSVTDTELSAAVFLGADRGTLTFSLFRGQEADGSAYLSGLTAGVPLGGEKRLSLSAEVSADCSVTIPALEGYYHASGLGALLKTLARSATHETDEIVSGEEGEHAYAVNRNFYLSGSAKLDALGILDATVDIVAVSVTLDEEGKVGVNLRLEYQGVAVLSVIAINGDTTLDITVKDGMVYCKRVQTTYFEKGFLSAKEKTYDVPVTLYRAMPLDAFFDDFLGQLPFLLNFGSTISDMIPTQPEGSTAADGGDLGAAAQRILTSFAYAPAESGDTWTAVLNGDALTDGVLGELTLTLSADADGILRKLSFACPKVGISGVTISADLTYCNPNGVMDEGMSDVTQDIAAEVGAETAAVLSAYDWTQTKYLAFSRARVTYAAAGETLAAEDVFYDVSTGSPLTPLHHPSLAELPERTGHTAGWETLPPLTGDVTVEAVYVPKTYAIALYSAVELPGMLWAWDEERGMYCAQTEYVYGTQDAFFELGYDHMGQIFCGYAADGNVFASLYEGCTASGGEPAPEYTLAFEEAEYTVTYVADGAEICVQTAHYGDVFSFPASAPEKPGYTFVGWDTGAADRITGDVTVQAVYEPRSLSFTLKSDVAFAGAEERDGIYTRAFSTDADGDVLPELQADGMLWFGWWAKENGAYRPVSSVAEFRFYEDVSGVELWAAWICDDLAVTVSEAKKSWGLWTVRGSVSGGGFAAGVSSEIFASGAVERSAEGKYRLAKGDADHGWENDGWGDTIGGSFTPAADGTFGKSGMTSFYGVSAGYTHAGATVRVTYTCGDRSVTLCVSGMKAI